MIEVTRALGDAAIALCSEVPRVARVVLEAADVVVLGCDGLFDELNESMVAAVLARRPAPHQAAPMLRDEAFFLGSTDNITSLVVQLL